MGEGIMSTVSIRIDEKLVQEAREASKAEFRTVQGQLELWALVGRAALDNPDLPASFIADSIMSMAESREDASDFVARTRKEKIVRKLSKHVALAASIKNYTII